MFNKIIIVAVLALSLVSCGQSNAANTSCTGSANVKTINNDWESSASLVRLIFESRYNSFSHYFIQLGCRQIQTDFIGGDLSGSFVLKLYNTPCSSLSGLTGTYEIISNILYLTYSSGDVMVFE